jgi:hypothetical protein
MLAAQFITTLAPWIFSRFIRSAPARSTMLLPWQKRW